MVGVHEHRPGACDGLPERVGDLADPPFGVIDLVGRQRDVGFAPCDERAGPRAGHRAIDRTPQCVQGRPRRVDGAVVEMGRHEFDQGADPDVGRRSDVGRGQCLEPLDDAVFIADLAARDQLREAEFVAEDRHVGDVGELAHAAGGLERSERVTGERLAERTDAFERQTADGILDEFEIGAPDVVVVIVPALGQRDVAGHHVEAEAARTNRGSIRTECGHRLAGQPAAVDPVAPHGGGDRLQQRQPGGEHAVDRLPLRPP